jgi:hypothetical protein
MRRSIVLSLPLQVVFPKSIHDPKYEGLIPGTAYTEKKKKRREGK